MGLSDRLFRPNPGLATIVPFHAGKQANGTATGVPAARGLLLAWQLTKNCTVELPAGHRRWFCQGGRNGEGTVGGVSPLDVGDGQHDLPMSDRRADFCGNVKRGQQGPLLVAQGAGATLLAGERDEHLLCVLASRTFLLLVFFSVSGCPKRTTIV
jgi:hypothetical protein